MQEFVSLTILMFSYRAQMPAQMTRDCTIVIHWLTRVSAGLLQYLHKLNSLSMITLFRPLILPGAMSFYIMPLLGAFWTFLRNGCKDLVIFLRDCKGQWEASFKSDGFSEKFLILG